MVKKTKYMRINHEFQQKKRRSKPEYEIKVEEIIW